MTPPSAAATPSGRWGDWIGWTPLFVLPLLTIAFRAKLLPWVFMWLLAVATFAGCKWQTWWEARATGRIAGNWKRSAAYFVLWPGMDADEFFDDIVHKGRIPSREWIATSAKILSGIALIKLGAGAILLSHPILGGWAGMVGLILILHFGIFYLLALAWQQAGVDVKPIMQKPLKSRSLSELWGNAGTLAFANLRTPGCSSH